MTTNNEKFLTLQHIEKVYANGEKAVYDFNLDVNKKEFIVIVGPSGCGKSTTLRMIAGLEDITSGDILMEGELLNYKPSNERQMAMVFQSYALYPQMNVFENIAFPLRINKALLPVTDKYLVAANDFRRIIQNAQIEVIEKKLQEIYQLRDRKSKKLDAIASYLEIAYESATILFEEYEKYSKDKRVAFSDIYKNCIEDLEKTSKENAVANNIVLNEEGFVLDGDGQIVRKMRNYTPYEIKNKVYKVAEMLDLITYIDKLPKELSGGQMQRVALGRAIVKNVPIFLMDEPLSNLDAKLRLTMRSEIVKLHNSIDATTIYVTHDQTEAMTMATRIVVMSRGFIQQIGTPEEVYNNPNNVFVAKFIGSPAMNFFTVNYDREKNSFMFGEKEISAPDDFSKKCQNFYKDKNTEFQNLVENFDEEAKIRLLKTLSGTGEYQIKQTKQESKTFVEKIKSLFKKKEEQKIPNELDICKEKLEILKKYNSGEVSSLLVGIRPERLSITKCTDTSNTENGFILKPTLCELLGSEYNVHCSIAGQNLIGRFDAIEKISTNDYIQVSFDKNSLYIFDPITGEIIK